MASKRKSPTDSLPETANVAALRARIADLEAREAEHARAEKVQAALYRIAEAASAASDLQAFYREVHATVATLMNAENFYIALYDDRRQAINFPYYVDTVDFDVPDPNLWEPFGVGNARGTTAYVLRTGRPAIISPARFEELIALGEIESVGVVGADWVGAPLQADNRTVGVVVCQTYTDDEHYTNTDRDLLAFVGQHIGAALTRVRAIEETRQRNDELALVNETGDVEAMVRPVHSMKSSSLNVGALELGELCRRLEEDARGGSIPNAIDRAIEIKIAFAEARAALLEEQLRRL